MRYRPLGNTGLSVSAVGLGGVALSIPDTRPDQASAIKVIHHAIDRGVTFIDTADSYSRGEADMGHNERLFRAALAELPADVRARVVVATKGGHMRPGGAWVPNGRPEYLRRQCEASLRNLGVERIDLLQHHRPDPDVPIADSIGAYARLREEGKVRFIGVSEYSVAQLDEAQAVTAIASTQNQYALSHRQPEQDGTLAATEARGLAFIPWSPLGGTGAHRAGDLGRQHPAVARLAERRGVSPQRLVLAWLLAKGPHVLVIVGSSRAATIDDSARAADLDLTAADIAQINAASA
jgi:aryl-alcohol dehydrogenase-like predicted oxidoreductase